MALSPGTRLGPFEIVALLGAGGMGEVYRARDTRLDRTIAIKVLAPELASDGEFQQRFHAEARAISRLTHPHICTLHDIGDHQGTMFLVMELLAGETLADRLARGTPEQPVIPLDAALQIGIQIADALAAAHQHGIIHRDLKPGNVMLTKAGSGASAVPHAKLLDFGLAKATSPVTTSGQSLLPTTPPQAVTAQGAILGTIQYMAPEQVEGGVVDARSDIFAFGSVLYEMLTGRKAFEGKTQASVMAAILEREPPPVSLLQPRAPTLVDATVKKCLAKNPDERWQSTADLATALRWAVSGPFAVTPVDAYSNATSRGARSKAVLAGAMALVAALGTAGGWTVARFRGSAPAVESPLIEFEIAAPQNGRIVFGNNTGGLAISPDGTALAYVASVNGQNGLWVRRLDEKESRLIPGTTGAGYSFWSPDGRSIGFVTGSTLKRVDLGGGLPLAVCRANGVRGAVWTSAGDLIFGSIASGLFKVSATGGTPAPLTTLDASRTEGFHGFPQLLSGDRFLYFVRAERPEHTGIYVTSLANPSQPTFLLQTEANALVAGARDGKRYLLWTSGGTLLAQPFDVQAARLYGEPRPIADNIGTAGITGSINASASDTGVLIFSASSVVSQLTWLDRTGKPERLLGESGDYTTFALSPDGRNVVASRERPGGSDLWLFDTTRDGVVTRLTSRNISAYPVWSPDGTQIAFGSEGTLNLFRKRVSGSTVDQRLTRSPTTQLPLDWSRDGQSILIYEVSGVATGRDLLIVPGTATGETTPVPYLRTQFNEWWGRFIPQSPPHWVAYQSDESGQYQIYIDSYPTPGNRRQISTGGGQYPQWGPGGRELFYLSPDFTMMAVALTAQDGVEPSAPRPLFRLPAIDTGRNPYEVAPDGQRFLVRAVPSGASQTMTAIVNWPALFQGETR